MLQGSRQREFTREGFGGLLGMVEGYWGNPSLAKIQRKNKEIQRKTKKSKEK